MSYQYLMNAEQEEFIARRSDMIYLLDDPDPVTREMAHTMYNELNLAIYRFNQLIWPCRFNYVYRELHQPQTI